MNLDLYNAFAEAIHPGNLPMHGLHRENLFEELKAGRFKDFEPGLMEKAVAVFVTDGKLPKMYCEDAQAALPTADKQNWKVLAHCAGCSECMSKVV